MKTTFKIFLFVLVYSSIFYAQSEQINNFYAKDSLKIKIQHNPLTDIQIKFEEFDLYRELNNIKLFVPIDGDPQTLWLRTSLAVSNTDASGNSFSPHYAATLYAQYQKDSKFNPVRYILGIAQVSAVGYLAYRHIKKYGFLK